MCTWNSQSLPKIKDFDFLERIAFKTGSLKAIQSGDTNLYISREACEMAKTKGSNDGYCPIR